MLDAIKPLLESGLINEDIGQQLNEAWEAKLTEARNQVRAELHEEFAQRYEHDRKVMVDAMDKMVTESLTAEITKFKQERRSINEDRIKAQLKLRENATRFNDFMITTLAEEIKELRADRKNSFDNMSKLENFVVESLAKEIKEFHTDRRAVVETRVKLVQEGRKQIAALKKKFIKESAQKISRVVSNQLTKELVQLKEDIQEAKQNSFGRKLFETFAAEYSASHLNEKAETRKVVNKLNNTAKELAESKAQLAKAQSLIESKNREVRMIREGLERKNILDSMLSTLNEEKAEVMRTLLESVQTNRLQAAFDKYLPAVLNNGNVSAPAKPTQKVIVEATGNKTAIPIVHSENEDTTVIEFSDLKRLAGL